MRYLLYILLFTCFTLSAQTDMGLITSFSFNGVGCPTTDDNGSGSVSSLAAGLSCTCGVLDGALNFEDSDDRLLISGSPIEQTLVTVDFTMSFYFKPDLSNSANPQVLVSKRDQCITDSSFVVSYVPAINLLSIELIQDAALSASLNYSLDPASCWYHVAIVRQGGSTILYIDGEEVKRVTSFDSQRVNISNISPLSIGQGDCPGTDTYQGRFDEFRLYNRALSRNEIEGLYFAPDEINSSVNAFGEKEETIILGQTVVQVELNPTCATQFQWTPVEGVSNDTIGTPILSPEVTTSYLVEMNDSSFCTSYDSIRVIVVDPTTIDCTDILLPSAFTPNGDGLNDEFGISNPFSTGELLDFEIFDRWGNIVYASRDVLARWDGTYKGTVVNPGVFLYKVHFRCEGTENVKSGSVTVIR